MSFFLFNGGSVAFCLDGAGGECQTQFDFIGGERWILKKGKNTSS